MTNPVVPTPITELPPAPLVTDTPEQFDDKAFPFAASLDTLRSQINVAAGQTNQNAVAAKEGAAAAVPAASSAVAARDRAETAASNAELSEESAEADADWIARRDLGPHSTFPTTDNQGRPIIVGAHFLYTGITPNAQYAWDGSQWIIGVNVTAGVTQINGEAGAVVLKTVGGISLLGAGNIDPGSIYHSPRSSNLQIIASDKSKLIDITAGTFTQTFAAAATLGDGWWCYLRNSGTGDITLDPNASEQIDGLTSYVMYPGECRLVQCDGVALRTVVLNAFYKTLTVSGSFSKPPGYQQFEGLLWGGGGGGAKGGTSLSVGGAGGGACVPFSVTASSLSSTTAVTIAAGGVAATVADSNGGAGGTSTFGTLSAFGGGAGGASSSGERFGGSGGGALAVGENGNSVSVRGGIPGRGISAASSDSSGSFGGGAGDSAGGASFYGGGGGSQSGDAGASVYGGGGGGGCYSASGGTGGTSKFGGAGGNGSNSGAATAATAPGGGGGSTRTGTATPGERGELRIWGII